MPLGAARLTLLAFQPTVEVEAEVLRRKVSVLAASNAQVDTSQRKFGGASYNGSTAGDSLFIRDSNPFSLANLSEATLECWVYFTTINRVAGIINKAPGSGNLNEYGLVADSSNKFRMLLWGTAGTIIDLTSTTTITTGTWYHVAATRNGTDWKLYVNGTEEASGTESAATVFNSDGLRIGGYNGRTDRNLFGFIDELRISNTARYTANFTPSTTPFVNDDNTLLLLHMDGTDASTLFEDDNGVAGKSAINRPAVHVSPQGNAQVDTAESQFGGASYLGDGAGDGLFAQVAGTPYVNIGTGDFTFECYFNTDAASGTLFDARVSTNTNVPLVQVISNTVRLWWNNAFAITHSTTINADTWYHCAVVRSSGDWEIYVNGVASGSPFTGADAIPSNTEIFRIGLNLPGSNSFDGHIDEVRVSNTARYTANFTPSTTPFDNDDNTLLLLHMDGEDASTDFPDDNTVPRRKVGVNAIGDAQIDTAQSYFGGASALFDGTNDALLTYERLIPQYADWTLEAWVRYADENDVYVIISQYDNVNGRLSLVYQNSLDVFQLFIGDYDGSSDIILRSTTNPSPNTWYHVAATRNGDTFKLFVNGTEEATTTASGVFVTQNPTTQIGRFGSTGYWNGHMDELRISNTARYTDDFIPQEAPFVNDANTLLLLHMDGTDGGTDFLDDNGYHTPGRKAVDVFAVGNAQVDTAQSKFGGASALFDGTEDHIDTVDNTMIIGTGDATYELWFRPSQINRFHILFDHRDVTSDDALALVIRNTDNVPYLYIQDDLKLIGTTQLAAGNWYHLAAVRSGGTWRLYVNGTEEGTPYVNANDFTTVNGLRIGGNRLTRTASPLGNIDEVRVSNTARYTANFTPSTAPFEDDTNTLLLLHMDGADGSTVFTDDVGGRAPVGMSAANGAQIDVSERKFGGASALFDGVDSYIQSPKLPIFGYGTGDFTLEAWIYPTNVSGNRVIINNRRESGTVESSANVMALINGKLSWSNGSVFVSGTTTFSTNTWVHCAVTRENGTLRIFVDGTEEYSATQTISLNANRLITIGNFEDAVGSADFAGNIDEVRVSNTARYTSNFTPSTTPFQNDANTLLLLHMDGTDGITTFTDDNGVHPA